MVPENGNTTVSDRDQNGRFVRGNQAAVRKAAGKAPGVSGVAAYSGFVTSGESNPKLIGQEKWVTYTNAVNKAVVATALRYFFRLIAGTEWHAEPNPLGGRKARKAAEIVEIGLINAPMLKPWPRVAAKAGMYVAMGFSLHATAMRRRRDGLVVYSAIEHRPQHTIERWLRNGEDQPFHAVVQRSRESSREFVIPLEQCFYCVDDMLTDEPNGTGLLRHVAEYVRRLDLYEKWEGAAFEADLNGVPYTRAPLSEIAEDAESDDEADIKAATDAKTVKVRDFMAKRRKKPEDTQWLMLDSAVYQTTDGNPTSVPKWSFEILKGETANLAQMDSTIRRVELQIARVFGIEWALMGADGSGSYAMHDDKTTTFEAVIDDTLRDLATFSTTQLARRLVAANGYDPDEHTPKLVADPIATETIEKVTRALANLAMAGLNPQDPAIPVLRKRMRVPYDPDLYDYDLRLQREPEPIGPGGGGERREEGEDVPRGDDPTGADRAGNNPPEEE